MKAAPKQPAAATTSMLVTDRELSTKPPAPFLLGLALVCEAEPPEVVGEPPLPPVPVVAETLLPLLPPLLPPGVTRADNWGSLSKETEMLEALRQPELGTSPLPLTNLTMEHC